MRQQVRWGLIGLISVCTVTLFFFIQKSPPSTLPSQAVKDASRYMRVYYYPDIPPHNFKLNEKSVTLSGGLLTFRLENSKNQRVTFTQQGLPKDLLNSSISSGEKIDDAPGSATVTFKEGRSIGTLLTKDKQTMIIANSSDGIETSELKDLIRNLRPL
jgi:hypothetical protein